MADSDLHRPEAHLGEALRLADERLGGIAEPEAGRCVGVDPVGDRTPHAVERKPDRLCGGVPHCGVDRREASDGDALVSGGVDRTPDVGPDAARFEDRATDGELGKPVHHLVERSDSGAVNRETEAFTGDPSAVRTVTSTQPTDSIWWIDVPTGRVSGTRTTSVEMFSINAPESCTTTA